MITNPQLNFLSGNTITTLVNAEQTYPAMLRAIHNAQSSIYFANFCVQKGKAADLFYQPLLHAARRGVTIAILLDAYGSKMADPKHLADLSADGIDVIWFNPKTKLHPLRYNKRMHKKLLVIDNKVGFTGGIGISDMWLENIHYPAPYRDTHFQIEGPIVDQVTNSFIQSWSRFSTTQLMKQEITQPRQKGKAVSLALIDTAPLGSPTPDTLTNIYCQLIEDAQNSIDISTPFFGPPAAIRRSLQKAAQKGIHIRILTNGPHAFHRIALNAGRSYFHRMLKDGVKLYEYQPTRTHSKIIVTDQQRSIIGSANLNMRSFRHDEEISIIADDSDLATTLTQQFEVDLINSKEIDLEFWQKRSQFDKVFQNLASLGRYFF